MSYMRLSGLFCMCSGIWEELESKRWEPARAAHAAAQTGPQLPQLWFHRYINRWVLRWSVHRPDPHQLEIRWASIFSMMAVLMCCTPVFSRLIISPLGIKCFKKWIAHLIFFSFVAFLDSSTLQLFFDLYHSIPPSLSPLVSVRLTARDAHGDRQTIPLNLVLNVLFKLSFRSCLV